MVATVSAFLRDHRRSPWAFPGGWTNPRRIRSKFVVAAKAISSQSVTKALRFVQRVKIGPLEGRFERIGRASLLVSHRPRSPCPMRLGGSLALPRGKGVKKLDSANGWLFPLTPGPSPRWGEGKVTLDLTPSPPSGERVVRRTADRVRGHWRTFGILSHLQGDFPGCEFIGPTAPG